MMEMRSEKDISGCSLAGFISESGERISGDVIISSIAVMHERGNGLGGGFAAYGIYPDYRDYYALHLICDDDKSREQAERFIENNFYIECKEPIPTRNVPSITDPPILMRYFIKPMVESGKEDDFVMHAAMKINAEIDGVYVISSGKNMGAFKAVGYPEDVGVFFRLEEYEGYTWIAHGRFPTNTPGWWGGAHPFTILDWAVVHNGEISSYGINKRYLEMFGYRCTLLTDTEVMAYLFDLLLRRHRLPVEIVAKALASPFWEDIERMPPGKRELMMAVRSVYGSALVNGPFAILLGYRDGLIGLNDRIKLRPLVAARKGDMLYIASEEAAIREITNPADVWMPKAGEPVIGRLKGEIQ